MAKFKTTDKLKLETLLQMEWGYVLNFTNNTLQSFVSDSVGEDIYDGKYSKYGDSKANRLRSFWVSETNEKVGKLLLDLLEYYRTIAILEKSKDIQFDEPLYLECMKIVSSLIVEKPDRAVEIETVPSISIWGEEPNFKVFLSHKSEFKREAATLKVNLRKYGISCFVAHNDVEPTKEWQKVIEQALLSTDALIALMTDKFFQSIWTNQEIGIAYGRKVFMLPIRLGSDPQGFISQFQALTCDIEKDYKEIVLILLKYNSKMVDQYIRSVERSDSWMESNELAHFLQDIIEIDEPQIQKLLSAYNTNNQVNGSMGFIGEKTKNGYLHGKGLIYELRRITGKDYSENIKIK